MHGASSDGVDTLEAGLSRNLNIVNRDRTLHGSPSKNRKRSLGDATTPPDSSDADVLKAPARPKPKPRPKMAKRAKLADARYVIPLTASNISANFYQVVAVGVRDPSNQGHYRVACRS